MKKFITSLASAALTIAAGLLALDPQAVDAGPNQVRRRERGDIPQAPEAHRIAPAMAADGVVRPSADLALAQPLIMVFIGEGCPCSESAQRFFNRLHEAYRGSVRFAGVINADAAAARSWAKANDVGFPLLLDPGLEIVRRYGVEYSTYVVLVDRHDKVLKLWPGYSADMLREVGHRLAVLTGTPEQPLSLHDAPGKMCTGCPY